MSRMEENIIIKIGTIVAKNTGISDVNLIGKEILGLGGDELSDGGFWVWDIDNNKEYYSPLFIKILGFEGEHDFPSVPESWQKQIDPQDFQIAIVNFKKACKTRHKHPYYQKVTYNTKSGSKVNVLCSGLIILNKDKTKPEYLIGTHKLI